MDCRFCGADNVTGARFCEQCGQSLLEGTSQSEGGSYFKKAAEEWSVRSRTVFVLLGVFFGLLGIHNFYAGYVLKGVVQFFIGGITYAVYPFTGTLIPILLLIVWIILELIFVKKDYDGYSLH